MITYEDYLAFSSDKYPDSDIWPRWNDGDLGQDSYLFTLVNHFLTGESGPIQYKSLADYCSTIEYRLAVKVLGEDYFQ